PRQHANPRLSPVRARLLPFRDGLRLRDRLSPSRPGGHRPLRSAPGDRALPLGGRGVSASRLTGWTLSAIALLSIAPLLYMARVSLGVGNALPIAPADWLDRKSTRLNSSHRTISYAVFCLKKKKTKKNT